MAEVAFCAIDGIRGDCNVAGQEGTLEVREFKYCVESEVDPLDCSRVVGKRRHGQVFIRTFLDQSYPLLLQALVESRTIDIIVVDWYRQPEDGSSDPEHYFEIEFEKCVIISISPLMSDATKGDSTGHCFNLTFGFRQVTCESITGGTTATDDFRNR